MAGELEAIIIGVLASGIRLSTPILFAALGEKIAERSGVLNLGVEGMMLIGAFAGFMGTYLTGGNYVFGVLLALAASAALAMLMGFMSITIRTNQLAAGLAIWLLGTGLAALLYRLYFGVRTAAPSVELLPKIDIPGLSSLPGIGEVLFSHDPLVYIALLLIPVTHFFIFKTNLGLKIRTVGENPKQADALGVNVYRIRYLAVVLGGALAGVGGAYFSLVQTGYFLEDVTAGAGWIALAVVIFGRWKAYWIAGGAFIFGMVNSLQLSLQATGTAIPFQFLLMLPYLIPIAILAVMSKKTGAPSALAIPYSRGER
jgi:general nucleoside transport system permease protein